MHDRYTEPINELRDEDLINPVEGGPKEPLTFTYDLARVPTLTAQELRRIEDEIYRQGVSAEKGQSMIYDALSRMGLKFEDVQHQAVVVDFVDSDGKHHLRPIRIDYEDFGTYIQEAQLENIGEDISNKEEEEQQRMVGVILGDIREDIKAARVKAEEGDERRKSKREIVDEALGQLKTLADRLMKREVVQKSEIDQLVRDEKVEEMQALVSIEMADCDIQSEGYTAVKRLADEVGDRRYQNPNLDDAHRDLLSLKIQRIEAAVHDMQGNRQMLAQGTEEAKRLVDSVLGTIDQLLVNNGRGAEGDGSSLARQIEMLRETIKGNRQLFDAFPGLVEIATARTE